MPNGFLLMSTQDGRRMEQLWCRICGRWLPAEDFYRAKGTRSGRRTECTACNLADKAERHRANPEPARERTEAWRKANPERYGDNRARFQASGGKKRSDRRSHLKRKFGLTLEAYDSMLEEQGGGCAVCGNPGHEMISLHVDHDHATGRVRGLLCFRCNGGMGQFREDPELLRAAAQYLEQHASEL